MKIKFSKHALIQMDERGAQRSEVVKSISLGEVIPAKTGRLAFRLNMQFGGSWLGKRYKTKQIKAIVVKENGCYVVVTVYVFYF